MAFCTNCGSVLEPGTVCPICSMISSAKTVEQHFSDVRFPGDDHFRSEETIIRDFPKQKRGARWKTALTIAVLAVTTSLGTAAALFALGAALQTNLITVDGVNDPPQPPAPNVERPAAPPPGNNIVAEPPRSPKKEPDEPRQQRVSPPAGNMNVERPVPPANYSVSNAMRSARGNREIDGSRALFEEVVFVPALKFRYYPMRLSRPTTISGSFVVLGDGYDIEFFIIDQGQLPNVTSGTSFYSRFRQPRMKIGEVNVTLPAGSYYLVFNNSYSLLTPKTINVHLSEN
jgi:hypothetical protein